MINLFKASLRICLLLAIPISIPASSSEIAEEWMNASLFHKQLTNKTCSSVPADKMNKVPGYENTHQLTDDCDYFYPSHTSLALHVFYIEWVNKFGDPDNQLRHALNNLEIEYGTYQRRLSRVFSIDGTFRPEPTIISGLTSRNGRYIFVWIGKGSHPKLSKTSFAHELVHVAIYASNYGEHGDPDHEGNVYKGWTLMHTRLIEDTNKLLKSMDL